MRPAAFEQSRHCLHVVMEAGAFLSPQSWRRTFCKSLRQRFLASELRSLARKGDLCAFWAERCWFVCVHDCCYPWRSTQGRTDGQTDTCISSSSSFSCCVTSGACFESRSRRTQTCLQASLRDRSLHSLSIDYRTQRVSTASVHNAYRQLQPPTTEAVPKQANSDRDLSSVAANTTRQAATALVADFALSRPRICRPLKTFCISQRSASSVRGGKNRLRSLDHNIKQSTPPPFVDSTSTSTSTSRAPSLDKTRCQSFLNDTVRDRRPFQGAHPRSR